jgi:Cytosine/adenosine deaminases
MVEALRAAHIALEKNEVPIGAIVVLGERVIAKAYNLTETLNDPTAHAEMQAITMATNYLGGKYLDKCELYVTVEPCPMCAAALNWSQLKRLVYGASDPKRGYSLFSPSLLHPKTEVSRGILEAECSILMSDFFKKKR